MSNQFARWFLAALMLVGYAVPGVTQNGTIIGQVRMADAVVPLPGALVQVIDGDGGRITGSLTNQAGRFIISNVPAGTYAVVATMTGYETGRVEGVSVVAGQSTSVDLELRTRAIDLDPVVVSASRRVERALDAPARVEVVGTQEIQERPAITPTDHLRSTPGVDVATSGVQSTNVVTRGFNNIFSGALHVLTDHRIAGVPSLRVNYLHFVPANNEDLDRMEVVLGPGAALYGPNTANGVLHMFTRSPLIHTGTAVSISGGEQSLLHGTFRTSHLVSENFGIKLSGQYFRADEWEHRDPVELFERQKFVDDPAFWRQDMMRSFGITQPEADARIARIGLRNFDLERWSGEARADWRIGPEASAVLTAGVTNTTGIELTGLGAAQADNWQGRFYQARANWRDLFGQVYLNTSDAGDTYLLRNGAPIIDRSRLFVGQLQHRLHLGNRQVFTYGVDHLYTLPRTEGTINGIYEDDDETREWGGYLQSQTALSPMFDLVLAGRVDTHSALPDAIFSPRAALVFKPMEDQAFRVSFNRAFSTPSSLNQFLDLASSSPNEGLARLGYSLRVQGTGRDGFAIRQADGTYQMRSPFTPAGLGGPAQLLPANATMFWPAAVTVLAQGAAARGQPIPQNLVNYLLSLQPTAQQIPTAFVHPATDARGLLAELDLPNVPPIREETQTTFEVGYKGILGNRLLLAADVWWSRRNNLVTPLTVQTPLLFMEGTSIGGFLVPRFMQDLGMSQAEAGQLAMQLIGSETSPGLATIPLGVVSAPGINANGAQLLVSYTNVDESIDLYGTDISATFLIDESWSVSASGSLVNDDQFTTAGGMPASRIAKWNGNEWSAIGSGANHRVDTMTVFDDGSGAALYAGGSFSLAGGSVVNRVAKWDGSSWSPLDSGLGGNDSVVGTVSTPAGRLNRPMMCRNASSARQFSSANHRSYDCMTFVA
jgi:outer membrane receptor for ferrienterochelin and colicins